MQVAIVGAGIGGLTLALEFERKGIACTVYEAAPKLAPLGAGINLLPHATKALANLGVLERLEDLAITTKESAFFNRYGQFVYAEPSGRHAGYDQPQLSIHRADLHNTLLDVVTERLGSASVHLGQRATGFTAADDHAVVHLETEDGTKHDVRADVVVGADGVHSVIRKQLFPDEGPPKYSGITMWRGVTEWDAFLSGATMARIGWLTSGKLVVYPVREDPATGKHLINWVAEVERPRSQERQWNKTGRLEDFIDVFDEWRFDWLDVSGLIRGADSILEYPMVDSDPLPQWSFGRVTLLGDAAHPMVPRGSNGAAQAILDATDLAARLSTTADPTQGLREYDDERRPVTSHIVLTNRVNPPDAILREVFERTGDKPFDDINEVITDEEMGQMLETYKKVAAYDRGRLAQ